MRASAAQQHARGVALIAVLWIVAALSVVVTGVVQSVRSEVRLVSAARQSVEAVALAEAAVMLTLQEMLARNERPQRLSQHAVQYQGRTMQVEVMPLNGLIDINTAPEALLARLFTLAGGLAPKAASELAALTVQLRSERDARGRLQGFEAVQDLLRVPGLGYDLYARLSGLITAEAQGSGLVNPQAAPQAVLTVLADGNVARAAALAAQRAQNAADIDTTALIGEFIGNNLPTSRYRLQVQVPLADGGWLWLACSVDVRADPRLGLPWRIFNAEHWMQAPPAKGI